ncbi:hypothetical protein [Rhodoferax aquaticus]|uniref:hypothetical protein n=1 Tax=Rhodoferax aquaticus TaxID=2527691 RepID=UPI00143D3468|nr:hypothetical protein [Rhodoferax aquaticus]
MKTFDQLAQAAYEAHTKELQRLIGVNAPAWEKLPHSDRACWAAAAKQLWAEFAAIH